MADNRNKEVRDMLTDDQMDSVTGGVVNEVGRSPSSQETGSIPTSGGISLEPANSRNAGFRATISNSTTSQFPQNCG